MESGIQLKEYGIPPRIGIRNPSPTDNDLESSTWNPESMAWNSESKIVLDSLSFCDVLRTEPFFNNHEAEHMPSTVRQKYSRLPITQTPYNSNLSLTRSNFNFISLKIVFYIILPSITRTPDNSNFFLFPLKVRIIGSRL